MWTVVEVHSTAKHANLGHVKHNELGPRKARLASVFQARLGAPLMQALQRLLAVLLSSAGGQDLVLHNPVAMGALLKALDPEADPYGPVFASDSQPQRSGLLHPFLAILLLRPCQYPMRHSTAKFLAGAVSVDAYTFVRISAFAFACL